MPNDSSQKFIKKNRAPRVQVEYDVELYGAEKKVNLPFVTGVISDLSGNPAEPLPKLEDRKFLEFDADNFDERLKSMKPRVTMQVPNVISGEGNIAVDMTFESMDDFSPAAVAAKVDGLTLKSCSTKFWKIPRCSRRFPRKRRKKTPPLPNLKRKENDSHGRRTKTERAES